MIENELIGEKVISQHYGGGVIINTDLDCLVRNRKVEIQFATKTNWFGIFAFKSAIQASDPDVQEFIIEMTVERFTVDFDCNPGEYRINGEVVSGKQEVYGGDKVTLPSLPERDGKDFVGWWYAGRIYYPGTEYTIDSDILFSAVWDKTGPIRVLIPPPYDIYTRTDPAYTYRELENKYGIAIRYFGRGINVSQDCIVLISRIKDTADFYVYHDRWIKQGEYIFSGEGLNGDQQLKRGNYAVVNAKRDKRPIYLYLKFSSTDYLYQGEFELIDYYQEDDHGADGKLRKEYKFHLRRVEEAQEEA